MTPRIGVYEKALPTGGDWATLPGMAAEAGYDFVELALDDAPERLARLTATQRERRALREAASAADVSVGSLVLSAHRRWPLGSPDATRRRKAIDLAERAVCLAADLDAGYVQLPGYFTFEEASWSGGRGAFVEALAACAEVAATAGVRLALENMDGRDVVSLDVAHTLIDLVGSPAVVLQPDLGNLVGQGCDVEAQLALGVDRFVGVHLKDARPGVYRRVPFGAGDVPFAAALVQLTRLGYAGPYTVEMWNDDPATALDEAAEARRWVAAHLAAAAAAAPGTG